MDKHTFSYEHNGSEVVWDVRDIWNAVRDEPVRRLSIAVLKLDYSKVSKHYDSDDLKRIAEADLSFPIIVSKPPSDSKLLIVDGYHRIGKCIAQGRSNVNVKYIKKMPRPLYCKGKPFEIKGLDFDWYDPRKNKTN